jgi:hypothetical protein
VFVRSCYGLRQNSAYRISQLEIAGEIMIKWPDLVFPPICLWNAPEQEELEEINFFRSLANANRRKEADCRKNIEICEAAIKEREFLYYLHSGRFPE